jgi:ribonuclease HI
MLLAKRKSTAAASGSHKRYIMPFKEKPEVTIYTDGSCLGNPGPGGWAAMLQMTMRSTGIPVKKVVTGNVPNSTNNRMELLAVIRGLQELKVPCMVTVYTDSTYVLGIMTKGWNARKNGDLIEELENAEILGGHQIIVHHVNGHSDNIGNQLVDAKAKEMSTALKELGHNYKIIRTWL